eukprot:5159898-Pyramimonas_sp.AAC.1
MEGSQRGKMVDPHKSSSSKFRMTLSSLYNNPDKTTVNGRTRRTSMEVNGHLTQETASAVSAWKYGTGRVNEMMLRAHLPEMGDDVTVFLCGPDPFMHDTCIPIVKKMGCKEDRILLF